jgi:hypothetical protein
VVKPSEVNCLMLEGKTEVQGTVCSDRVHPIHPKLLGSWQLSTGPPSGQSTTVTFTYEIVRSVSQPTPDEARLSLRGIAKDIYASFGGGEAYLRQERANFYGLGKDPLTRRS